MKYSTLIFDLDGVLFDGSKLRTKNPLMAVVSDKDEFKMIWYNLLIGKYTTEQCAEMLIGQNPASEQYLRSLLDQDFYRENFPPIENAIKLVRELSKEYNVFILSNTIDPIKKYALDYLGRAGIQDLRGIFSYEVGSLKPYSEIYSKLLLKYNIDPKQAIFFDDSKKNCDMAKALGIHAVQVFSTDNIKNALF